MSRREEVEAELSEMDDHHSARYYTNEYSKVAIALADEVDALRAEADDERALTMFVRNELATANGIITELLALLKPGEKPACNSPHDDCQCVTCDKKQRLYARACEIAGRTE